MRIKALIVALMILSIVILAGCNGEGDTEDSGESPYIGGNKGIVGELGEMGIYSTDTSINEIFEGESFPIEILLKNRGEHEVAAGDVTATLIGISLSDFTGIVDSGVLSNTGTIEKISEFNEEGGEETLDFTPDETDAVYNIALSGSSYDVNVFANVVYAYKTYAAVPQVCFKEDLTDTTICNVAGTKDVFSSAGPIQVQSAKQETAGTGKIAVRFEIENVGSGDVTVPGEDFDNRYNQLSYEVSDAEDWECKSSGFVNKARLDSNGKATVICKLKEAMPEDTLYTKQLDLTLSYEYKDLIQESVRIKAQ